MSPLCRLECGGGSYTGGRFVNLLQIERGEDV